MGAGASTQSACSYFIVTWEDGINVRSRAQKDFSPTIGILDAGAEVMSTGAEGDWLKIEHAGGEGWVLAKAGEEWGGVELLTAVEGAEGKFTVSWQDGVNVQSKPSTDYVPLVGQKDKGEILSVTGQNGDWCELQGGGWVLGKAPESWGGAIFVEPVKSADIAAIPAEC